MKKIIFLTLFCIFLNFNIVAEAHHCHSHYYVTYKDYFQEEQNFVDCEKHYVLKETTIYYYSNGTRRSYTTSTIFNNDGSIVIANCRDVKHFIHNKKHYFTFYQNKKYNIMDENGKITSVKNYKTLEEVAPNRLLVKLDKKYGIIDLNENRIVPIKYQKFKKVGEDLFLTKLNGYYGLLNSSNKILVKNEYDKISPLYDTFLLKKEGNFGLANSSGQIILQPNCNKIKKFGEYILVKQGNRYGLLSSNGDFITDIDYKKIKLERNSLFGKTNKNIWEEIKVEL